MAFEAVRGGSLFLLVQGGRLRRRLTPALGSNRGGIVKPQQLEKWKATREKGMLRYVLVTGVLSYGLTMFVAMTFFVHRDDLSAKSIAISAVIWTLGGAVFGTTMWLFMERQFRKAFGSAA